MTSTLRDAHGEALSTTNRSSLAAYDHALELFHGYRLDPVAVLTPALERDPGFVSGHLLMPAWCSAPSTAICSAWRRRASMPRRPARRRQTRASSR